LSSVYPFSGRPLGRYVLPREKGFHIELIERLVRVFPEMGKTEKAGIAVPFGDLFVVAQKAEMIERIDKGGRIGLAPHFHAVDLLALCRLFSDLRHRQLTRYVSTSVVVTGPRSEISL
jgi:hypothetical protein